MFKNEIKIFKKIIIITRDSVLSFRLNGENKEKT